MEKLEWKDIKLEPHPVMKEVLIFETEQFILQGGGLVNGDGYSTYELWMKEADKIYPYVSIKKALSIINRQKKS